MNHNNNNFYYVLYKIEYNENYISKIIEIVDKEYKYYYTDLCIIDITIINYKEKFKSTYKSEYYNEERVKEASNIYNNQSKYIKNDRVFIIEIIDKIGVRVIFNYRIPIDQLNKYKPIYRTPYIKSFNNFNKYMYRESDEKYIDNNYNYNTMCYNKKISSCSELVSIFKNFLKIIIINLEYTHNSIKLLFDYDGIDINNITEYINEINNNNKYINDYKYTNSKDKNIINKLFVQYFLNYTLEELFRNNIFVKVNISNIKNLLKIDIYYDHYYHNKEYKEDEEYKEYKNEEDEKNEKYYNYYKEDEEYKEYKNEEDEKNEKYYNYYKEYKEYKKNYHNYDKNEEDEEDEYEEYEEYEEDEYKNKNFSSRICLKDNICVKSEDEEKRLIERFNKLIKRKSLSLDSKRSKMSKRSRTHERS